MMACAYLLSVALLARWGRDEAILGSLVLCGWMANPVLVRR